MIFLPLIFYSLWAIFTLPTEHPSYKKLWIPGVIGYSGLIHTHILTCGMAAIFTILGCLICIRRVFCRESFFVLTKIVLYTALANLWFLIPFADYTLTGSFRIATAGHDIWNTLANSAEPLQVLDPFVRATGGSALLWDGIQDDACLSVGIALLLGSLLLPLLWLEPGFQTSAQNCIGKISLGFGVLALGMTTTLFPWYTIGSILSPIEKFISTMQFTWRFLSLAGLFLALACAAGLHLLRLKNKKLFASTALILGFLAIAGTGYFYHDLYANKYSDVYYDFADVMSHTDHTPFQKQLAQLSGSEYLPAECNLDEVWLRNSPDYDSDSVRLTNYTQSALRADFSAENRSAESQKITVPFLAYKGYRAALNEQEVPVSCSSKGQIQLELPAGFIGNVTVRFVEPVYWRVAEGISLASVLLLIGFEFVSYNRKKKNKDSAILSEVYAS